MKVHTIEIDDENLNWLLTILECEILARKTLVAYPRILRASTDPRRNIEGLGAATMIRDNIIDQTGVKQ